MKGTSVSFPFTTQLLCTTPNVRLLYWFFFYDYGLCYQKFINNYGCQAAPSLVGLLQRVQQGLQTRKVADKLEDAKDAHHAHQPDYLARLPDDLKVFEALEQDGEVEGDDGEQVDEVHWALEIFEILIF